MSRSDEEKRELARSLGLPLWKIPLWDGIHAWVKSIPSVKRGGDLMGAEHAVVQVERVVEEALAKVEKDRDALADALVAALPAIRQTCWSETPYTGSDPQRRDWQAHPLYAQAAEALRKAGRES